MKIILPQGNGTIKKTKPYKKLTDTQKMVWQKVNDPINGPLFFAEHCCWVIRQGLEQYNPFEYQREMLFNMNNYQNLCSMWTRQGGKCFCFDSEIKIRNKKTKNVEKTTVYEFIKFLKNMSNK